MTRLRQPERQVLDTLVDAGVARSRSDALAWSVKLVGEHADEWLGKLRDAMRNVDDLRAEGPELYGGHGALDLGGARVTQRSTPTYDELNGEVCDSGSTDALSMSRFRLAP